MGQIAADTLGIPLDRVRVFHGSTSYLEEGYGAFHSRSTISAARRCSRVRGHCSRRCGPAAAARFGGSTEEIELVDGHARISDGARFPSPNSRRTVCGSMLPSRTTTS